MKNYKQQMQNYLLQLRNSLLTQGVPKNDVINLETELLKKMDDEAPPRIAVIGETGVGKSSTINALFNTNLAVHDFAACTQRIEKVNTGLVNICIVVKITKFDNNIFLDFRAAGVAFAGSTVRLRTACP